MSTTSRITQGTFTGRFTDSLCRDVRAHYGQLWCVVAIDSPNQTAQALYAQGYHYCQHPDRGQRLWILVIDAAP